MQDAARCRLILLHLDADAPAGAAFAAASRCRFALCAVWSSTTHRARAGCSTAPHTAQRLHTLAPGRNHAGLRRSGSCRGYSSRQLPLRRGWRQGPASSSQASTMSWRTALQQAMMISKTHLHDMGAAPVDPDGDRSRHHRKCSEDRLEEWRQRPACQRWPRQLFWP